MRTTEFTIDQQGAVVAMRAGVFAESERIACVELELQSKYAELVFAVSGADGKQTAVLAASDRNTRSASSALKVATHISFPEFRGWSLFATSGPNRYTLRMVFVKEES